MTGRVAAVLLAAGHSRRMGAANKLLIDISGRALVRIAVEAAAASQADPVIVVTGHEGEAVRRSLDGLPVAFTHNPDHAGGMASSLAAGLASLPDDVDAAVVLLADMPAIASTDIDALIDAFDTAAGAAIVAGAHNGQRGHPVLWSRGYFAELRALTGDRGGRRIIEREPVTLIELGPQALRDIDNPADLAAFDASSP